MYMLTGRRYLLALTPSQEEFATRVGAACRFIWNVGLEQRREYRRRGSTVNYFEQARQLADAKKEPGLEWLSEIPAHPLQQALRDLEVACRRWGTFRVRWKSKDRSAPSFRFPDPDRIAVRRLNRRWGEVRLPRFGPVRFRWTRSIGGTIRNATVSRAGGRWYISFCVEDGIAAVAPNGRPAVGVDLGVAIMASTSDGARYDRQLIAPGESKRLKRLQQRLSRSLRIHKRNRRSGRRSAVRTQFGLASARIAARRNDFAVQTAVGLVRNYGLVVVEDLRVKNMTASAKGTAENPGRNVRQKAGLNRAIRSKGWGRLLSHLEHAARYHGATVVKVNPAYTSQRCSRCGHVDAKSRESQAAFVCTSCSYRDNADVNAAKNILAAGLAVTGRGDLGVTRSTKRQPAPATR